VFWLLIPCLIVALLWARREELEIYLLANLAQSVICCIALRFWTYDSRTFAFIFAPLAGLIFLSALPLLYESIYFIGNRRALLALSLFFAALLFRIASHDHLMGHNEWIEYTNGAGDAFLGFSSMVGAAYLRMWKRPFWKVAMSFGAMLMVQSFYEFGWSLHLGSQEWITLNQWMPSAILCVGSLTMAIADRMPQDSVASSPQYPC
jgi:hypothetical protein